VFATATTSAIRGPLWVQLAQTLILRAHTQCHSPTSNLAVGLSPDATSIRVPSPDGTYLPTTGI